jgi:hypothetical protein
MIVDAQQRPGRNADRGRPARGTCEEILPAMKDQRPHSPASPGTSTLFVAHLSHDTEPCCIRAPHTCYQSTRCGTASCRPNSFPMAFHRATLIVHHWGFAGILRRTVADTLTAHRGPTYLVAGEFITKYKRATQALSANSGHMGVRRATAKPQNRTLLWAADRTPTNSRVCR